MPFNSPKNGRARFEDNVTFKRSTVREGFFGSRANEIFCPKHQSDEYPGQHSLNRAINFEIYNVEPNTRPDNISNNSSHSYWATSVKPSSFTGIFWVAVAGIAGIHSRQIRTRSIRVSRGTVLEMSHSNFMIWLWTSLFARGSLPRRTQSKHSRQENRSIWSPI